MEAGARRLASEVERRRTFAIISHPDAGKTTLTEKLLLFGGAVREAGAVRAQRAARYATSDWLELEKQRGISVSSSVMHFDWNPSEGRAGTLPTLRYRVNILDTPGHRDFSEDTYRTLLAADSAVMLIDAAKGVEAQTRKLFEVCRLRHIPIFTFVNKMDRHGRDPLELMTEIEEVLKIDAIPLSWPIGAGSEFRGICDRVAFLRICSGRFARGADAILARTQKPVRLAHSSLLMGQGREEVDEAFPGDVVGLFDPGVFRIGDTLSTSGRIAFGGIPTFSPEHFRRVEVAKVERRLARHGEIQLSETSDPQLR